MTGIASMGVITGGALDEQVLPKTALRPQALAAAANGIEIDRQRFNAALVTLVTGATSGSPTAVSVAIKIQHTATSGSGWADALQATQRGNALVTKTIADPAADKQTSFLLDLSGLYRYVRVVVTPAFTGGSSPDILASSELVLAAALGDLPVS